MNNTLWNLTGRRRSPKRSDDRRARQDALWQHPHRLLLGVGLGICLLAAPAFARKPVTATVNTAKTHQEIAGFGAAEAYFQGYLAHHPHRREIFDALFGPVNGLHTDFLRLQNSFRYQSNPDFDPDTVAIVKEANSLRDHPLTIVMSSWSPPASLKSNNSEKNGGTLIRKNGRYDYDGFAKYWKDAVLAYRAAGVDPAYVSIQNEPDITTDYESCRFNPTEAPYHGDSFAGYDKAADAVYAAFRQLPSPPRLLGAETLGIGSGNEQDFTKALNPDHIFAVTHHLYTGGDKRQPDTYIPALQAIDNENPGRLKFQTEYYTANGYETALMMHNSLVAEEVNLYLYWPYSWPGDAGTLLTIENPAEPAKWKTPQGWSPTDEYYAFKQFSYFIHPHYLRVDASSSTDLVKVSAYLSPSRDKLVVVAINTSETDASTVKLKLGEFEHGHSQIFSTAFSSPTEHFVSQGALGADNTITLPPHSMATVEITR